MRQRDQAGRPLLTDERGTYGWRAQGDEAEARTHRGLLGAAVVVFLAGAMVPAYGQQWNSDNYWTSPRGTLTTVVTVGQNYSTLLSVVAFAPNWEFNLGATLFQEDKSSNTVRHFSTISYFKYMIHENAAKNGGWSVMFGTGVVPGFYQTGSITSDSKSYWAYVPVTIPFARGTFSWDIMPGFTVNKTSGTSDDTTTGLLYSTRLAVYKVIPQSAIVGEVFGTDGDAYSKPQYRLGVRWETKHVITALSYSAAFDGSHGAGVELGVLILSPPFLCRGGC